MLVHDLPRGFNRRFEISVAMSHLNASGRFDNVDCVAIAHTKALYRVPRKYDRNRISKRNHFAD